MTNLMTKAEAEAFKDAVIDNLIPAGTYRVKITSIEPLEDNPERKCFKLKVVSGDYAHRQLRAWPSTAPDLIWTMRKLIGEVVEDPTEVQLEDLEGHVFMAEVTQRKRTDNGEMTNDVARLTSCVADTHAVPWDEEDEDS